jgi:DNA-binding CsgD family transcriptional regulator
MSIDASRLNAAERQLLALLAQGHSVKSAAALAGLTENAVNERLREARRKTGVGSSRELARLVVSQCEQQETCDDFSGVGHQSEISQRSRRTLSQGQFRVGGIVVIGVSLGAVMILAFTSAGPAKMSPPVVLETAPAEGQTVPPGSTTIRVTFDRPMQPGSFSFVTTDRGRYPHCARAPRQSRDGRSFLLACRISEPGRYAIGFNGGRFRNFVSKDAGIAATPSVLTFTVAR